MTVTLQGPTAGEENKVHYDGKKKAIEQRKEEMKWYAKVINILAYLFARDDLMLGLCC